MNTSELISAVMLKATGKARTLQEGDTKYQKIFGIANLYIRQWQSEPNVDWASTYDPLYSPGQITAGDTVPIDLSIVRKISDTPDDHIIVRSNGQDYRFATVQADQLQRYRGQNVCAQVDGDLKFAREFDTDSPEFGGTVYVPIYKHVKLLENNTSPVLVDDPMWLVTICAAEYVRNDVMLRGQYPNLVNESNVLMQKMIQNETAQINQLYAPSIPGVSDI